MTLVARWQPARALTHLDMQKYDRSPALRPTEREALEPLLHHDPGGRPLLSLFANLLGAQRLLTPIADALAVIDGDEFWRERAMLALLQCCASEGRAFWGFNGNTWLKLLSPVPKGVRQREVVKWHPAVRQYMIAAAYVFGCLPNPGRVLRVRWQGIGHKVFGRAVVDSNATRIEAVIASWGYTKARCRDLRGVAAEAMIRAGSAELEALSDIDFKEWRANTRPPERADVFLLSKALAQMGLLPNPLRVMEVGLWDSIRVARQINVPPRWHELVERWEATSTLEPATRTQVRTSLFKIGRWLWATHPDIDHPQQWTRELSAECVAAIVRWRIGEFTWRTTGSTRGRRGQPLSAGAKAAQLYALTRFFEDAQEWEWIPRRFNALRTFAVPRSIAAQIGPNPRTIADDVWAKLLWAGLNLSADDVPRIGREGAAGLSRETFYPEAMLRALTLVWLFAGLRSDEIVRLRPGCTRWLQDDIQVPGRPGDILARGAVCLLDVPAGKTSGPFTKPVDPVVGRAVAAWEAVRPSQPPFIDRKTGESVELLFCHRAKPVQKDYLNNTLIPALCNKAGVPRSDARGDITSHRARATIASQLYNAKDPMTLFELQAWLGHSSPESTQHYARLTPTTLAKAYTDAGYFARNIRAIEVLVDRDAVTSGDATSGKPWQFFDLGHGYCTYSFFEQCPHRMACARCDFYVPKGSTKAQLLEAQSNLQRMLVEIPLTDDERAAVEEGGSAVERLLERLAQVATPAGPTPRQISERPGLQPLPVIAAPPQPTPPGPQVQEETS